MLSNSRSEEDNRAPGTRWGRLKASIYVLASPMAMDAPAPAEDAQVGMISNSKEAPHYRVYAGRFYVLIAFALLAGEQALSWMTFGTIPNETFKHFGLTDDDITLLSGKYY